jgi:DNA-binding helix-turn-helix protein
MSRDENRKQIGKLLSHKREEKGITIEQLAIKTGLSEVNLMRIEEGRYNIGVDMLMNIINALETKILLE